MSEENKRLFSRIAGNYDLANRIITFGADRSWRKELIKECLSGARNGKLRVLDFATGTADIPLGLQKEAASEGITVSVTGLDFSSKMLGLARKKIRSRGTVGITLVEGDALRSGLPFSGFDAITSSFALRNFDDLGMLMKESFRILKPNGRIFFLDTARPKNGYDLFYRIYCATFVRLVGAVFDSEGYSHLTSSAWMFDKDKAAETARKAGFKKVSITNLGFGAAYILKGEKPKTSR